MFANTFASDYALGRSKICMGHGPFVLELVVQLYHTLKHYIQNQF